MNTALVLTLIAFIFVAFALLTGKVAPSVACGISIAFLWITGVVDETQVFENFISSNVIVMIGMMIVIAALLKTSILSHIASLVKGNSIRPILIVAMIVPFILCQFIGGVTSMITVLPLLIALASQIGIAPTRLVLPASVGAQIRTVGAPHRRSSRHVSAEESDGGECRMSGAAGILGFVRDTHAGNHRSDGIHGDLGL